MKIAKLVLATALVVALATVAQAAPPAPETQRVLALHLWMMTAEEQCPDISEDLEKVTKMFHSAGLRWGDIAEQITVPEPGETYEHAKAKLGEPEGIKPDPDLAKWMGEQIGRISDEFERYATPEERSSGRTHNAKAYCEKMWKAYGPGSQLQLLDHKKELKQ